MNSLNTVSEGKENDNEDHKVSWVSKTASLVKDSKHHSLPSNEVLNDGDEEDKVSDNDVVVPRRKSIFNSINFSVLEEIVCGSDDDDDESEQDDEKYLAKSDKSEENEVKQPEKKKGSFFQPFINSLESEIIDYDVSSENDSDDYEREYVGDNKARMSVMNSLNLGKIGDFVSNITSNIVGRKRNNDTELKETIITSEDVKNMTQYLKENGVVTSMAAKELIHKKDVEAYIYESSLKKKNKNKSKSKNLFEGKENFRTQAMKKAAESDGINFCTYENQDWKINDSWRENTASFKIYDGLRTCDIFDELKSIEEQFACGIVPLKQTDTQDMLEYDCDGKSDNSF